MEKNKPCENWEYFCQFWFNTNTPIWYKVIRNVVMKIKTVVNLGERKRLLVFLMLAHKIMHFLMTSFYVYHILISFSPQYLPSESWRLRSLSTQSHLTTFSFCLLSSPPWRPEHPLSSCFYVLSIKHPSLSTVLFARPSILYKCFMIDIFSLKLIFDICIY